MSVANSFSAMAVIKFKNSKKSLKDFLYSIKPLQKTDHLIWAWSVIGVVEYFLDSGNPHTALNNTRKHIDGAIDVIKASGLSENDRQFLISFKKRIQGKV